MAAKSELELREILLTTGMVQPLKTESRGGKVSALCRQLAGQEASWLKVVDALLHYSAESGIPFHLCRQYSLKDDRLVFGWYIGIEARNGSELSACLVAVRELLAKFEPATEMPVLPAPAPKAPVDPEEDEEALLTPAQAKALEARRAAYATRTSAPPRSASGETRPELERKIATQDPSPRVVFRGTAKDQKNRIVPVVFEEVPLPGVFTSDMNAPNEKGRGAKTI